MGIKINRIDFEERVKESHPFSKFKVIYFDGLSQEVKFKCEDCGREWTEKKAENVYFRINLCGCKKHFFSLKNKVLFFIEQDKNYEIVEWRSAREPMSLRCLKCGNIFLQTPTKFIGSQKDFCPICNNNTDEQTLSKEGAQQKIDKIFGEKKYEVMTYQNYKASCRLKHECGFEFTQRFDSFVHSVGCPKCVNRRSKGEEAIFQWLKDKNIHFKEQYKIEINDRRFYFDFFIPGYDLAIEYQGEQHYIDKPFFKETLEERTKRDTLKREYCHQHEIILLEIPYWELKNIPQILSLKLNDYLERE